MPQRLSEDSRAKLDGIVHQMTSNGEPEDAIQFVVSDFKTKYALPDRPVSAEDFMSKQDIRNRESLSGWPAKIRDAVGALPGVVAKGLASTAKLGYDATMEPMLHPLRPINESPFAADLRGIGAASAEQLGKAKAAAQNRDPAEYLLRLATSIPMVGPAMAQAGEKIGAGDPEGLAEAAVLAGAPVAGKAIPAAGRAAGRAAAATGRAVVPLAKAAAPLAVPLALDAASHYFGGPMGFTLFKALKASLEAKKAASVAESAAPVAEAAAGRLVRPEAVVPAEAEMAAMLEDVRAAEPPPPARITTPPPAELPAGYTPRTTVPKPKPAKAELPAAHPARKAAEARAAKPKADATMGPRNYFLREPPPVATAADATPLTVDLQQLPTSWRTRTDQPIARVTKAEVSQMADALLAEGISPSEAMNAVASNPQLPPQVRTELMTALGKIAKRGR